MPSGGLEGQSGRGGEAVVAFIVSTRRRVVRRFRASNSITRER